ncbi:O-succinylbenzoate synthase [Gracilibacillus halotolerans]|uniref:o-succinylbenzoate synthase n=1 Tax=Gracilibacillus halotolerans TaxID=74386 RepID=A0A841RNS6_9BACI|nr:o-succinylbenzoate synthase [Gracilibacillus halotolerans]MBB6513066.1 O-succinylbenzoate synthase [Gracilibacillus halotolerans]
MMTLKRLILHELKMPLRFPFQNSKETVREKRFHIIELMDQDGVSGFGETVAFESPWYTEETTDTVAMTIEKHIWPVLRHTTIKHPSEFQTKTAHIKRHHMAKAGVEGALWDLYAKKKGRPLYQAIGGTNRHIEVGVAIGIQKDMPTLLTKINQAIAEGYKRVKLKVSKGNDIEVLETVREAFPAIDLMVDANGAYNLQDLKHLKQIDQFKLMMIEQPLASDDFVEHARLQEELHTPICLDESIHTLADAQTAIALESCRIISMKLGKVGGFTNAIEIHNECAKHNIPVWCGGMLEAGVGRAQSLALATLPNFQLPADTGASQRYWKQDIIQPEVEVENGVVELPQLPGIGYEIDLEALLHYRSYEKSLG